GAIREADLGGPAQRRLAALHGDEIPCPELLGTLPGERAVRPDAEERMLGGRLDLEPEARPHAERTRAAPVVDVARPLDPGETRDLEVDRPVLARHRALGERREDRKSTRLNSSHVSTSYAVFCFKKKSRHSKRHVP